MALINHEIWLYEIGPIDYWTGWTPLEPVITNYPYDEEYEDLESDAEIAKVLIEKYTSWEGDGHWYVSGMPTSDFSNSLPMFAVKQSNNGSTFICTPFPLPWLEAHERIKIILPDVLDRDSWIVSEDNDDRNDLAVDLRDQYFRYLRILDKGKAYWNEWRQRNPNSKPFLRKAKLANMDLQEIDFSDTDLWRADLKGANLSNAILMGANLVDADLILIRVLNGNIEMRKSS